MVAEADGQIANGEDRLSLAPRIRLLFDDRLNHVRLPQKSIAA